MRYIWIVLWILACLCIGATAAIAQIPVSEAPDSIVIVTSDDRLEPESRFEAWAIEFRGDEASVCVIIDEKGTRGRARVLAWSREVGFVRLSKTVEPGYCEVDWTVNEQLLAEGTVGYVFIVGRSVIPKMWPIT